MTEDNHGEGPEQNAKIQPDRPVSDIKRIQLNPLLVAGVVASGYLPQAGQAALDARVQLEAGSVARDFLMPDRARANQAHIAAQDVPQLRQLVQARLPQKASDPGNAGIVLQLVIAFPFLAQVLTLPQVFFQSAIGIENHGAKFPSGKELSAMPNAFLSIKHRALGIQPDQQRDEPTERQHEPGTEQAHHQVQQALGGRRIAAGLLAQLQAQHPAHALGLHPEAGKIGKFGHDQDMRKIHAIAFHHGHQVGVWNVGHGKHGVSGPVGNQQQGGQFSAAKNRNSVQIGQPLGVVQNRDRFQSQSRFVQQSFDDGGRSWTGAEDDCRETPPGFSRKCLADTFARQWDQSNAQNDRQEKSPGETVAAAPQRDRYGAQTQEQHSGSNGRAPQLLRRAHANPRVESYGGIDTQKYEEKRPQMHVTVQLNAALQQDFHGHADGHRKQQRARVG